MSKIQPEKAKEHIYIDLERVESTLRSIERQTTLAYISIAGIAISAMLSGPILFGVPTSGYSSIPLIFLVVAGYLPFLIAFQALRLSRIKSKMRDNIYEIKHQLVDGKYQENLKDKILDEEERTEKIARTLSLTIVMSWIALFVIVVFVWYFFAGWL